MKKNKNDKVHIGIYGRRNYGKSSIVNSLASQEVAIVSDTAGTTTDLVKKSFEILDYAPVVFVDTAGVDDIGELGEKRVNITLNSIAIIDLAILVIVNNAFSTYEENLIKLFNYYKTPFFIIHNKSDLCSISIDLKSKLENKYSTTIIDFSTQNLINLKQIIELIKETAPNLSSVFRSFIGDIIKPNDIVMLICPIDSEAPSGRIILPQVQLIRDVLDNNCISVVLQPNQVEPFLTSTIVKPKLVIVDSQIFDLADKLIPDDIPLTSFSMVLARQNGNFQQYLNGTPKIDKLLDGDRILILESCSHHVSCDDIGRYKLPKLIREFTNKQLEFDVVAGLDNIKRNISDYAIVIQCGGCMITKKQISNRLLPAIIAGVAVTNYGLAIAWVHGIYDRAVKSIS